MPAASSDFELVADASVKKFGQKKMSGASLLKDAESLRRAFRSWNVNGLGGVGSGRARHGPYGSLLRTHQHCLSGAHVDGSGRMAHVDLGGSCAGRWRAQHWHSDQPFAVMGVFLLVSFKAITKRIPPTKDTSIVMGKPAQSDGGNGCFSLGAEEAPEGV